MVKKRLLSFAAAIAMAVTSIPFLSVDLSGQSQQMVVYADECTVPELKIDSKNIPDLDCFKYVADMGAGWNLGNTFDAVSDTATPGPNLSMEYSWVGTKTSKEIVDTVKSAGFNTIRIPVSWHNHVDADFTIYPEWLDRVQEVVDYAFDNEMHVILNIHHDNEQQFMYPDSAHLQNSLKYVGSIWTQVAEKFKDYNENLIFESLNEPRLKGTTYEWWYNSGVAECRDAANCLNQLNQKAVDTIRGAGGNNASRYIMIPAYCASMDSAISNDYKLPTDTAKNRLIVSVHAYTPYNFALNDPTAPESTSTFNMNGSDGKEVENLMETLYVKFVSKNIPVVIGEFGARNKEENNQDRTNYMAYYYAMARSRGISCVVWDNHAFSTFSGEAYGLLDRNTRTWRYESIVAAAIKYGSSNGQVFVPPTNPDDDIPKSEGEILPDGTILFAGPIGKTVTLDVTLKGCIYGNGCLSFSVTVDGVSYWVAYQWAAETSGKAIVDMTAPSIVQDIAASEASGEDVTVEDPEILAKIAEICMQSTSTIMQYWYAADPDWNGLEPASDYITVNSAEIALTEGEATTTTTTTDAELITTTTITTVLPVGVLYGDVTLNGVIEIGDVVLLARYVSQDAETSLTSAAITNADCVRDESIDAADISAISQYLAGIIPASQLGA